MAYLEHVNITVRDAKRMAVFLQDLFDWNIRWEGTVLNGYSVHVGTEAAYVAFYTPDNTSLKTAPQYTHALGFNHMGIVVDDLDAAEARVRAKGYEPHHHANYEPGRRFYFMGPEGVEIEVVSYD